MRAGDIDANMNRPRRQGHWRAVRSERSRARINAERAQPVLAATARTRPPAAPSHVEILSGRMRPRILDTCGNRHRTSLDERGIFDVHLVLGKLGPHGGVKRRPAAGRSSGGATLARFLELVEQTR